jgi:hypothetical protein
MIRNLLIIMGVGLILAVVGIGGAFAVGGPALMKDGWAWSYQDGDGDWVRVSRDGPRERGPEVTRTMTWTGGDRLIVDAPADVVFTQGPVASVRVTGPQERVEHLRLVDGRLEMDPSIGFGAWRRSLRVEITAPDVSRFQLNGSQTLRLEAVDVPALTLGISGSGEIEANGRADRVSVDVSGSGDLDLRDLTVTDADVEISGSGEVAVGPTGKANVRISGSGDVDLTRRPASVSTNVSGSGDVNESW